MRFEPNGLAIFASWEAQEWSHACPAFTADLQQLSSLLMGLSLFPQLRQPALALRGTVLLQ